MGLIGAAYGLARLKSLYAFDMKPFIDEGVISTTLDNGQVVLSDPSVLKLNCKFTIKDLELIQNPPIQILSDFSSCPYIDLQINGKHWGKKFLKNNLVKKIRKKKVTRIPE